MRFPIAGKNYLRQCGLNGLEVVAPGRNTGFCMIVTGREGSRLWACPESHEFVYYWEVVRKIQASTLYMKEVIISPLAVFVGEGYLQHLGPEGNGSHRQRYCVYFILRVVQPKETRVCVRELFGGRGCQWSGLGSSKGDGNV